MKQKFKECVQDKKDTCGKCGKAKRIGYWVFKGIFYAYGVNDLCLCISDSKPHKGEQDAR